MHFSSNRFSLEMTALNGTFVQHVDDRPSPSSSSLAAVDDDDNDDGGGGGCQATDDVADLYADDRLRCHLQQQQQRQRRPMGGATFEERLANQAACSRPGDEPRPQRPTGACSRYGRGRPDLGSEVTISEVKAARSKSPSKKSQS